MPKNFERSVLKNGVRVLTESFPQSHAINLGIWVLTGTRDEPRGQEGVSHLLEHMVFKGTRHRSAKEIAMSLEAVGGDLNAFTTKEYTCYHTLTLKDDLELSVDVLSDLVVNASFPAKEFEREKSVVLQEISMSYDDHGEYIYDCYLNQALGRHKAGIPILGTERSLKKMSRGDVVEYYKKHHYPKNILVTGTGALKHDDLVKLIEKKLGRLRAKGRSSRRTIPKINPVRQVISRPSEQVHILFGMPSVEYKHPLRLEAFLLNTLLGGGMTSRLYQVLREKMGLAYSVYSYMYSYVDFSMGFHYIGTDKKNMPRAAATLYKELLKIKKSGVRKRELDFFKKQIRGSLLLNMDDLESRMTSLAHNEIVFGKHRTIEQIVAGIEKISMESLHQFIEENFDIDQVGVSLLGPFAKDAKYSDFKLPL